jgi:hypothetical protein
MSRLAVVLAALVGGALATAAPGFAADEPLVPEIPSPPELPTVAPSVAPIDSTLPPAPESDPSTSTQAEPPITVTVDADAGNIDVSVRVLSPGEDASAAVEPPVVSGSEGADTTADPARMTALPAGSTGDHTEGSNTNVTVRVLSPGDNGLVDQSTSPEDGTHADAPAQSSTAEDSGGMETPAPTAAGGALDAAENPSGSPNDGGQYQGQDSRYQSGAQFVDDAWSWIWYLSLDCDGNATSSSVETGHQSSRDWTWEWTWEWACGSPPHPPPIDSLGPSADDELTHAAPEGSDSTPTSTATADGAASGTAGAQEPWLWTWAFTFCGETVTATLPIDPQADLEWVWEWLWTWTCQAAPATDPSETPGDAPTGNLSPAPATGVPSESSGSAPGGGTTADERPPQVLLPWITPVELPEWVISLLPPDLASATIPRVPAIEPMTSAGPFTMMGDVLSISLPSAAPGAPVAAADAPVPFRATVISQQPPQRRGSTSAVTSQWPVAPVSSLPRRAEPPVEPRAAKAPPRATRRSTARSGGNPLVLWPPLRPFQAAGGPGASSSFVPSVSVLGTAALVALFVLAAPGFGRRIRVARELRPRGTYGSSIDHPG